MRGLSRPIAFTAVLVLVIQGWGSARTPPAVCEDAACLVARGRALIEKGDAIGAVAFLKEARKGFPDDRDLLVLLGVAYLKSGNSLWAIRTFQTRLAADPDDCEARAWIAWAYLEQAALDEAWEATEGSGCIGEAAGRLAMVRALVAGAWGEAGAAVDAVRQARAAEALWPRDLAALNAVIRRATPEVPAEIAWRLEVAGGYTSNALLGSPTDPASGAVRQGGTGLGQADAWLSFSPWVHAWVRPAVEFQTKATGFSGSEVRGLSWLDLTGRVGLSVGKTRPRVLLGWRPEWLLLAQGDRYDAGPVWYFSAHRGEYEVEVAPWLLVFGGAGRRTFRETARARFEADGGLGGKVGLSRVTLLWAATGRVYRANHRAWNLWGVSAVVQAQGRLPWNFVVKAGVSTSVDAYPDSAGYGPFGQPDRDRRDVLMKPLLALWSPPWHGARAGVQYEFSWRDSTLPRYGFEDHRLTLRVSWTGDGEVFRPAASGSAPVADLPWGTGGEEAGLDRVQDLLRQDEAVQRSSSCVQ